MSASVLIDANVFVYADDATEPVKAARAREWIADLVSSGAGVVSSQVVGEYVNAVERKFRIAFTTERATESAHRIIGILPVLAVDDRVTREALRAHRRYGLDYWDAQLFATARIGGVDTILTEDVPADELEGIRYVNPFLTPVE